MTVRFIDHTADILFEVSCEDIEELFTECATTVTSIMAPVSSIKPEIVKIIKLNAADKEKLLLAFLEELIFIKDADSLLFSEYKLDITSNSLTAVMKGDRLSRIKDQEVDIKAITYHEFSLRKTDDGYTARVLVDI